MEARGGEFKPENEDMKCAVTKKITDGSCFTLQALQNMVHAYNKEAKEHNWNNQGKYPIVTISNDKATLVRDLTHALKITKNCDDQTCWITQSFLQYLDPKDRKDITHKTFRPKISQKRFIWLSSTNIDEVMGQYEEKYPNYKFMGALPINFDALPQLGIKNLNPDEMLSKGKSRLGFIFNLDEHWQSGSHWISLFVDLEKSEIYFSDSVGKAPPERVVNLIRRLAKWMYRKYRIPPTVRYNKTKHQKKNSECGVYSINFILRLLKGESFEEITGTRLADEQVNECRKQYFRFK